VRSREMKSRCFWLKVSALAILALASIPMVQAQNAAPKRKVRIAVLDFDYATVTTSSAAVFGTSVDVGKGIADLLVTDLVKDGTYSIIERKMLDKVLAEQNFSNSNRADPNSAAKIGRLLGVDAMLVGSITQFGNDNKQQGAGGGGAASRSLRANVGAADSSRAV